MSMEMEIKFRAWDVKDKVMKYSFNEHDEQGMIHHLEMFFLSLSAGKDLSDKTFELMQFTGLLDKSGKEIFERDIVKRDGWIPCEVWWEDGTYLIGRKGESDSHFYQSVAEKCEIIGNVFQTPDLLK